MKTIWILKTFVLRVSMILSALFMGTHFMGCGDDDPIPEPIASFTFIGTNNFHAPTTVTFTNTSQNASTYSWDFGYQGQTSTEVNPTFTYPGEGNYTVRLASTGEGGSNWITQNIAVGPDITPIADFGFNATNGQEAPTTVNFINTSQNADTYAWDFGNGETGTEADPSVTYTEAGTYPVSLIVTGQGGTASTSQDIVVTPFIVEDFDLQGVWSIVKEEVTYPGSSTPIVRERPMNWSTLSYDPYNGTYDRVSLTWVEFESGVYTLSNNVITQTPTGGNDDFSAVDILVTSIQGTTIEAEVTMNDPDVGMISIKLTLEKTGPEYFGEGPLPKPSIEDFIFDKWSTIEETTTVYAYSSDTDEYSEVVSSEFETFTYNYQTFYASPTNSLLIDNWSDGVYSWFDLSELRQYSIFWLESQDIGSIFLKVDNNLDGDNIETVSVWFAEINGEKMKFQANTKLYRNDGSEATVTYDELKGQWEVMSKTETSDGVAVDPSVSNTPAIGFVLSLNGDQSADLGDADLGSWFYLDECNFVVVSPEGDESLVHLEHFDKSLPLHEMHISSLTSEDGSEYKLTMLLRKQ